MNFLGTKVAKKGRITLNTVVLCIEEREKKGIGFIFT